MSAPSALATAPAAKDETVQPADAEERAANVKPESGQPAAEVETKEGEAPIEPAAGAAESAVTPALSQREREQAVTRIKQSAALPPALRERLATLVEASGELAAGGQMRVPLAACLEALEQSLPDFLRHDRAEAAPPTHPAGEAFFRASGEELSDELAEELAQRQLARSGLLRGQRVRVAD